ncbi:MAG: hypothetical protein HKN23_10430 [Verrucomicrobiales bacterium]|nr:hypothetical protein [Verrucomicrobiales bacterium]
MSDPAEIDKVREHIRLLSIFHYVVAGITAAIGFFPIFHLIIGILMLSGMLEEGSSAEDIQAQKVVGGIFVAIAGTMMISFWLLALLIFLGGRKLKQHRAHTFCLIIGGIACLMMPHGTVLGVFTIITLMKPEAKELFGVEPD